MRKPFNANPARGWHHGGALETVQAAISNGSEDTTVFGRLQVSRLASTLALLPDTSAALAIFVYGGRS